MDCIAKSELIKRTHSTIITVVALTSIFIGMTLVLVMATLDRPGGLDTLATAKTTAAQQLSTTLMDLLHYRQQVFGVMTRH
jgi:hypothetical protein